MAWVSSLLRPHALEATVDHLALETVASVPSQRWSVRFKATRVPDSKTGVSMELEQGKVRDEKHAITGIYPSHLTLPCLYPFRYLSFSSPFPSPSPSPFAAFLPFPGLYDDSASVEGCDLDWRLILAGCVYPRS